MVLEGRGNHSRLGIVVHRQASRSVFQGATLQADAGLVQVNVMVCGILEGTPHHAGLVRVFAVEVGDSILYYAIAHRRGRVSVTAISEIETPPATRLTIQRCEGNGGISRSHSIQHTITPVAVSHSEIAVLLHLDSVALHDGKFWITVISTNGDFTQEGIAIDIIVPNLVGFNITSCHGNVRTVVGKSDDALIEGERTVGRV